MHKKLPETHEFLLHDKEHRLYEGASCNLFVIRDGTLFTAPLESVLPGTMQRVLEQVCEEQGIPVVYDFPKCTEVDRWDAAFLTSTSRVLVPIERVLLEDGKTLVVVPWRSCPLVLTLQRLVREHLRGASTEVFQ